MPSEAVPFYLKRVEDAPLIGTVDFTDTFSYIKNVDQGKSLWQEIADTTSGGVQKVYDTASGTWSNIKSEVSSIGSSVTSGLDNFMQKVKDNVIFFVVIGLVVIYFVAKSGILHQIAELVP